MKILIDTNILISAVLFPHSKPAKALPDAEVLLSELSYELIPAISHTQKQIRDIKDQPILNAAMLYNIDIILTGDKDFLSLNMEQPKCMTTAQFLAFEGVEES